ncbi:MAG: hypothetical protein K8I65_07605 [Thermoanaerobaculia bacterium]|nr:hypothetical protein [Thermoanaerobaculia bacterium]
MSIKLVVILGIGAGLGVLSNFIKARWSVLLLGIWMLMGYVRYMWPAIDVATWGYWDTLGVMLTGVIWYVIPTTIFHVVPFSVGRYSYKIVDMLAERWPRG